MTEWCWRSSERGAVCCPLVKSCSYSQTTKYVNMDYLFCSSLHHSPLRTLNVSYDIACQWSKNLWDQMTTLTLPMQIQRNDKQVKFFILKFHLPAHIMRCQTCYLFNFIPVMLALLRPYIICHTQGSNSQPHYDNSHYQPLHSLSYATPWPRLSHSLMAIRLMSTSRQILHHAYRTASHLGTSCISSLLYDPYLASCSSHVFLMTCTCPIGYDPLI